MKKNPITILCAAIPFAGIIKNTFLKVLPTYYYTSKSLEPSTLYFTDMVGAMFQKRFINSLPS